MSLRAVHRLETKKGVVQPGEVFSPRPHGIAPDEARSLIERGAVVDAPAEKASALVSAAADPRTGSE